MAPLRLIFGNRTYQKNIQYEQWRNVYRAFLDHYNK